MSNPLFRFDSMRGRNNLSIGSLAEIKFIITSVVVPQSTSKFAALIKNANDSGTFNTSLENKSIFVQNDLKNIHQGGDTSTTCTDANSDIINVNKVDVISDTASISGEKHSSEILPMNTSSDSYTNLKGSVTSSTPVKSVSEGGHFEPYRLDLHTPPEDASFIDSDIEPFQQDECKTPLANNVDDNVSDDETLKYNHHNDGLTPKDFSFKKPLQSSLRRHKRMLKEPRVLKFFTSRRRKKTRQQHEQRSSRCETVYDSDSSRSTSPSKYNELGCKPLLVAENIKRFYKSQEWGDDFDFSFICEPSTSDLENDDENVDANSNSLNISTYNFQPPCVPTFRITDPNDRSHDLKEASVHVLRRSLSNPNSMFDLLDKSSENFVEGVVRFEGTTSHCASVRNLDTLSVSCVFFNSIYLNCK